MSDTFQHTAARRRLTNGILSPHDTFVFQHTAARRRLIARIRQDAATAFVSTHSRAKAAEACTDCAAQVVRSFNTQPREGG